MTSRQVVWDFLNVSMTKMRLLCFLTPANPGWPREVWKLWMGRSILAIAINGGVWQVKGFELDPNYNCNYNFPYYQELFEAYGFQTYFEQITFIRKVMDPLNPRLKEKADRIFQNPKYSFQHMRLKEIDKYTEYFRDIYNAAWAAHKGVPQLSLQVAKHLMKQMKPIIDEKIMWFGFYEDEPIAFFIMLPEVNQIFKHVNGKMNLIGKIKFVWHKWRKTNKKMFGMVFGIVPDHQGKGVEGSHHLNL
jgi:hypothetical protein